MDFTSILLGSPLKKKKCKGGFYLFFVIIFKCIKYKKDLYK